MYIPQMPGMPQLDGYGRPIPQPVYATGGMPPYSYPAAAPGYPYGGPSYAPNPMPMAAVPPPASAAGMFTRNLIGSLAVNAFKLTDTEGKLGFWFVLQDLSVRTEGTFRYEATCIRFP